MLTGATYETDPAIYFEEEISIPIEHLFEAIEDVNKLVKKFDGQNFNSKTAGFLCRFVSADQHSYLSTTVDRNSVFVSITTNTMNKYFFQQFEKMMYKYKGRPHWGKINFLNHQKVLALYGKNMEKFNQIRKQFDPRGLYLNNYTEQLFE